MSDQNQSDKINAEPTKAFFVQMLVRDIPLEQAVLDLVDNCIDGAKRIQADGDKPLTGKKIEIEINDSYFRIYDNCGGFDKGTAKHYAFRFGRPKNTPASPYSIGQFGVGMKRALFKFGREFSVRSATQNEHWGIDVNVNEWEETDDWSFPWVDVDDSDAVNMRSPGTEIVVKNLRSEVKPRFGSRNFVNNIVALIKAKHRQFVGQGLSIRVNDIAVHAAKIELLKDGKMEPGVKTFTFSESEAEDVKVKIVVGLGQASPREAGWYVICNGRVVLEADRRAVTGWGVLEEEAEKVLIPSFHNQFARFRGIVTFESRDSSRVPWNTTKTDVDQDSAIWQQTFLKMLEMMRPVIDFLREIEKDIQEHTRERSPLIAHLSKTQTVAAETVLADKQFSAPRRDEVYQGPRYATIQYSRLWSDIEYLKEELCVNSAKAVGERSFDIILKMQRGE